MLCYFLLKSKMAQSLSKIPVFSPINTCCKDYVHPWTTSCMEALCGLYFCSILYSLRMYTTVYLLSFATKKKLPTKKDVIKTVYGILQSTAFLSGTAFGYSAVVCLLRRILGNFNILTVSFFPAFISSIFSIIIERSHRRSMLALYVSNIATETVWNMLLSRNIVKNIKYGDIAIFAVSSSLLLMYYKAGWHKKSEDSRVDPVFSILKFIVGPYEEKDYASRTSRENSINHLDQNDSYLKNRSGSSYSSKSSSNSISTILTRALQAYRQTIENIKCCDRHLTCPHPFSCLYYTSQGAWKMFGLGLGIQIAIKLVLNMTKIVKSPTLMKHILFKKENINLGAFMGGFAGLFRATLCLMRRTTGRDIPAFALPAGLLAGTAFAKYPNNTVTLYVMWKMLQISYNIGIDKGLLPKVPGFTEFLYCFSTGILFHVAIIEPTNLRPSYWKFLHGISGGRIACMSRPPLDVWGLETSKSLAQVLHNTKTEAVLR
ncbi:hypothetical protein WA026_013817 [Henosepilachna vigintioctopunctata]|uniref:Transmembrane protein 135 N-terminal domain-containing protein n=1 Tax=Henosepilachna vigintioctopunctata TaxID=420089 RepID=A0AAW1UTY0_9CUCU